MDPSVGVSAPETATINVEPASWVGDGDVVRRIRLEVFVREQRVPVEEELDGQDATAHHVLAFVGERPVGTGRLVGRRIGRMAVLRAARGRGVGGAILRALVRAARDDGHDEVVVHAQEHAVSFYEGHGFTVSGEPFEEAGIPHVEMRMRLAGKL